MKIRAIAAAFGVAMVISQGAGAITIINTDSTVGGADAERGVAASAYGAPPLPSESQSKRTARDVIDAMHSAAGRPAHGAVPLPESERAVASNPPGEFGSSDQHEATAAPGGINLSAREPVISVDAGQGAVSSGLAPGSAQQRANTSRSYSVPAGWLSDAMRDLAKQANYELMWEVGDEGRADFRIHRDFMLPSPTARLAVEKIMEPYPIRLCIFEVDRIAKVVPAGRSCL